MRFLIVGATGVAGSTAITAIREAFGSDAHICALWYGKPDPDFQVAQADTTLFGDIGDAAIYTQINNACGSEYDWCFYATAHGEVGFPVVAASGEQIQASNRLSYDPLLELEARLTIGTLVAYSTFYNLDHQAITYGAMGHSKAAIERWALMSGRSRHRCLRAGAFRSASSQGIKLLVRRRAKQLAESTNPLLRQYFAGVKPSQAVEDLERAVFDEERRSYGDSETDSSGLVAAHLELLRNHEPPFVNVCGAKVWTSHEAQPLA